MTYELVGLASGNVIEDYDTLDEALSDLYVLGEFHDGWPLVLDMALVRIDGDAQALMARRGALVFLAAFWEGWPSLAAGTCLENRTG